MSALPIRFAAPDPGHRSLAPGQEYGQKQAGNETDKQTIVSGAPDEQLIADARRGDHEAFGRLVERYYRAAYASAYSVLGNGGDAEEIAQETFVQVYQKLDKLREPGALTSWIWRIARDTALKHIRKHKRIRPVAEPPEVPGSELPEAGLVAGEEKQQLLAAMESLPDEMRQALVMRYWEELDYDQMAVRTGVSAAALYQRVCRGLKQLREQLGPAHG